MSEPALCQCTECHRYLTVNRDPESTLSIHHRCEECFPGGIKLTTFRGTVSDPLALELLALLTEECGETSQRVGKIVRWGWDAMHEGTTQQHKLEVEIGDILAATALLIHNGFISAQGIGHALRSKLAKLREDAAGPRQRLLHAAVPDGGFVAFAIPTPGISTDDAVVNAMDAIERIYCRGCGVMQPPGRWCQCQNDE